MLYEIKLPPFQTNFNELNKITCAKAVFVFGYSYMIPVNSFNPGKNIMSYNAQENSIYLIHSGANNHMLCYGGMFQNNPSMYF